MKPPQKRSFISSIFLSLKVFLMGTADIIPGVSGGTMALITGIYEPLLNAIRSIDARVIGHFFTLPIWEGVFTN